jgi:TP901 family phage tail tape measure protein
MHGFMGALQSAYGYAQDLNGSLNDIRIVTGASADKMADFAKEANKAAKALSTTTNEYAKASLIFYQQGLSSGEVTERTNITIKMANAAGASAQQVSDQLTAVWNNFYDGSKSLEFYADAMTALGAATASSTDEIADGLEKFAAIADTVGLSYEYAAAALATVTATTRQSADVVGTAFKTLFARLQDLELGKTLDDGTSLGKYSAALSAVGINIKDVSGQMKSMDTILDELGGKW